MSMMQDPVHPGEVLDELYLKPLDMSAIALAKKLHVPRTRIERLVRCQTGISTDTALRLARFFGTTPEYWLNMQRAWELARARRDLDVSDIEPLDAA